MVRQLRTSEVIPRTWSSALIGVVTLLASVSSRRCGANITTSLKYPLRLHSEVIKESPPSTEGTVLKVSPHSYEFMIVAGDRVLADRTVHRLPVHNGHCITATPSSPTTLLEVVLYALWGAVVNYGVHILQVHPHAQSSPNS